MEESRKIYFKPNASFSGLSLCNFGISANKEGLEKKLISLSQLSIGDWFIAWRYVSVPTMNVWRYLSVDQILACKGGRLSEHQLNIAPHYHDA